ncbi:hypothetical protein H310_13294 [Aphanomyces invadans]|uniref:Uncharacterized protein n=1 Tax=Aphanomyces invadans TaxID=157072 RepID=A0A024TEG4_9STRA|nr:hypothetical protein H310_13294 [Aphanomyces invadans]ETV92408.1 hypothetical protein H310_13294 [Aphanomyces invadans]|eukprot:XP_008878959.1 hypothetical protein H310_13294 [Aphanomyces invadans]
MFFLQSLSKGELELRLEEGSVSFRPWRWHGAGRCRRLHRLHVVRCKSVGSSLLRIEFALLLVVLGSVKRTQRVGRAVFLDRSLGGTGGARVHAQTTKGASHRRCSRVGAAIIVRKMLVCALTSCHSKARPRTLEGRCGSAQGTPAT